MMVTLVCFDSTATATEVYLDVVTALLGGTYTLFKGHFNTPNIDQISLKVMCDMLTHVTCVNIYA